MLGENTTRSTPAPERGDRRHQTPFGYYFVFEITNAKQAQTLRALSLPHHRIHKTQIPKTEKLSHQCSLDLVPILSLGTLEKVEVDEAVKEAGETMPLWLGRMIELRLAVSTADV